MEGHQGRADGASGDGAADASVVAEIAEARQRIVRELGKRIVGQEKVIDLLLVSLFARGHSLFIGVPGLAKTLLISTLAEALSLTFNRIQFTPDLMPADITGTDILEEDHTTGKRFFKFIKGPVFCNMLLADEINRTPPKTQAALLQAMQEHQVTASGTTFQLDPPFLVFATQNPIEQEGTYPLPEAQLDRFMFSVGVEYPAFDEEMEIVRTTTSGRHVTIEKVVTPEQILRYQDLVLKVPVSDHVIRYAVRLAQATRPDNVLAPEPVKRWVAWGAGPRASQYLILAGKARAVMHGRSAVSTDDVRALAPYVLQHRVLPSFQAEAERVTAQRIVEEVLLAVPEKA